MADIETFRQHIIESGYVLDPEGTHHEFVSGMHGQKLDFDNIKNIDPLYQEWIGVAADFIREQYPRLPEIIIGVANGTNRVALDVVGSLEDEAIGLKSRKNPDNSKELFLGNLACHVISALSPELVVVIEDVGTTGSNSVQVALDAQVHGAQQVEVVTTWKRRPVLERLEEANILYRAIINEPLPIYTPEDCRRIGYCSGDRPWELIPREK